ncbi:conserved domain protein [Streptococcus mitis SK569]|nr:conserved domain protein [Streptococcus mitis SK569]
MSMYFTKLFKNSIYKSAIQKPHSDFSLIVSKAEITVCF